MEEFDKTEIKYVIHCRECGHKFLPWKCLMVTIPQNNMQPYVYCPNCRHYDNLENFRIN